MDDFPASLQQVIRGLSDGHFSSVELTQGYLDRISKSNPELNAIVELDAEGALGAAKQADQKRKLGSKQPLLGIPIAVKDNICVENRLTTCGSKILEGYRSPYDATVVAKLKNSGAILLAKTNLDEFAMGGSTETSIFGPTKNPRSPTQTAGGSSGGSAAAVAAGMVAASLGSDTGGSIRQPASFCGISGMKPTYGRVSRYGLVAFASSLDQIGPLAPTVADLAILLDVICGPEATNGDRASPSGLQRDSTCLQLPPTSFANNLSTVLQGLRVGIVPEQLDHPSLDGEVRQATLDAIDIFRNAGASIVEVSLSKQAHVIPVYYVIATSEASSNLSRYDGAHYGFRASPAASKTDESPLIDMYCRTRTEGFGAEVRRRILLGTYALSAGYIDAYYLQACRVRRLIRDELNQVFEKVDVLAGPVAPTAAYRLNEQINDPLQMYLADLFTVAANLAGLPALSVPCGQTSKNLPIGLHLQAKALNEELLLRAGHGFQTIKQK